MGTQFTPANGPERNTKVFLGSSVSELEREHPALFPDHGAQGGCVFYMVQLTDGVLHQPGSLNRCESGMPGSPSVERYHE